MSTDVVITGIGTLTPHSMDEYPCNVQGRPLTIGSQPVRLLPEKIFVPDFDERMLCRCDRITLMVASGFSHCHADARLDKTIYPSEHTGIISGSAFGSLEITAELLQALHSKGPAALDPIKFPLESHNYPISLTAVEHKLKGPIASVIGFISASLVALQMAALLIRNGKAERMFVVGADEIGPVLSSYIRESDFSGIPLPSSENGGSPGLSEGCTAICIERLSTARSRNVSAYGKILSVYSASSPYGKIGRDTIERACRDALGAANLTPADIDLISLNSSAKEELEAMNSLFEEDGRSERFVCVKREIGNFLGASGLTELAFLMSTEHTGANLFDTALLSMSKRNKIRPWKKALLINYGLGCGVIACVVERM